MSDKPVPSFFSKLIESPEELKDTICKSMKEQSTKMRKEQTASEKTTGRTKVTAEPTQQMRESQQESSTESPRDKKNFKLETSGETLKIRGAQQTESAKDKKQKSEVQKLEISGLEAPKVLRKTQKMEPLKEAKHVKDVKSSVSVEASEEKSVESAKANMSKPKTIPVLEKDIICSSAWNAAVPRIWAPISMPNLNQRPLVLATHLVPSLPIGLFEVLAEIFEVVTKKPVVLLHETRIGRPVAKDVVDIAILPAIEKWNDGVLLPASFVFEHHLNKNNSPYIYADVIVAADCAARIDDIMDLRGHRCAVPDRRNQLSAAGLFFNHLRMKGESPAFFGNTLDASSQLAVLQMVVGKQAEVGVLEGPVIGCQKFSVLGAESLHILTSLGPLPPYRVMINRMIADKFAKQLTTYLLSINQHEEWMERLSPFGIVDFAENSKDYYDLDDMKSVVTSVPYY